MLHLVLHLVVPLMVAIVCFRKEWPRAFLLMMAGMLIDIDHLLADPIYDPSRCSIGFHPLHAPVFIAVYILAALYRKTRLVGLGLCIHIGLDLVDCRLTTGSWIAGA